MEKKERTADHRFMVIVLGDANVGKTALIRKWIDPAWQEESKTVLTTLGVDFVKKHVTVERKDVQLQVWDTAGQERFRSITMSYFRSASGAIVGYSADNRKTLDEAKTWIMAFREKSAPDIPIILVCCKQDLAERPEEGRHLGASYKSGNLSQSATVMDGSKQSLIN